MAEWFVPRRLVLTAINTFEYAEALRWIKERISKQYTVETSASSDGRFTAVVKLHNAVEHTHVITKWKEECKEGIPKPAIFIWIGGEIHVV